MRKPREVTLMVIASIGLLSVPMGLVPAMPRSRVLAVALACMLAVYIPQILAKNSGHWPELQPRRYCWMVYPPGVEWCLVDRPAPSASRR